MSKGTDRLLPTTQVGSYPRPLFMEGPVFGTGNQDAEYVSYRQRELYRDAVSLVVKDQLDAGLDVVTDGAQHYENESCYELAGLVHMFPNHLDGYRPFGDNLMLGALNVPVYKPTVTAEIGWRRPIFKPVLEAVQAATPGPAKLNIGVGPVTLALLSTDQHYGGDIPRMAMDLARAYNAEIKDLEARGLAQVQFAEPLQMLFAVMEPAQWISDAINTALDGVNIYKVNHMCYGHQEGQSAMGGNLFEKVFPWAFDLNFDQLHLEAASHAGIEVTSLKGWPADKDLGVGVIDSKSLRCEDPDVVAQTIRDVIGVVPADRVNISTDCSMASFRRVVAKNKLAAMAKGAAIVRGELEGKN